MSQYRERRTLLRFRLTNSRCPCERTVVANKKCHCSCASGHLFSRGFLLRLCGDISPFSRAQSSFYIAPCTCHIFGVVARRRGNTALTNTGCHGGKAKSADSRPRKVFVCSAFIHRYRCSPLVTSIVPISCFILKHFSCRTSCARSAHWRESQRLCMIFQEALSVKKDRPPGKRHKSVHKHESRPPQLLTVCFSVLMISIMASQIGHFALLHILLV